MSNQKYTTEKIIEKFKTIHGDEYDYTKTVYTNYNKKIIVTCKIHGDFSIKIGKHLNGQGCPHCRYIKSAKNKRRSVEDVINDMKKVHGDVYDYSLITDYKNTKSKLPIICKKHGIFYQTYDNHVRNKQNCPICGQKKTHEIRRMTTEEFVEKARMKHGDKYDYSLVNYVLSDTKVNIICPTHGIFEQQPRNHLHGQGCPKCFFDKSNIEREILEYVQNLVGIDNVIENDRTVLDGKEVDIFIPSKQLGFEINGLIWHSEKFECDKNYHLNKTLEAQSKNIHLIHIFEDDWFYKQDIIKSRIKNLLGCIDNKIYARNCVVKDVSNTEANEFLITNHIQGKCVSKYRYGLYYNNVLVALMTFGKPRKNVGRACQKNEGEFELLRFCNKINTVVVGGASKLFNHFIKEVKPTTIISYADRCWSQGNLYEKLHFNKYNESNPSYSYVVNKKRVNRFNLRKDVLVKKYNCPIEMTEHDFCLLQKWYRIYDCGCLCYQWKLN